MKNVRQHIVARFLAENEFISKTPLTFKVMSQMVYHSTLVHILGKTILAVKKPSQEIQDKTHWHLFGLINIISLIVLFGSWVI